MKTAEPITVRCVDCDHFRLKEAGKMAVHGFGLCAPARAPYAFLSAVYLRACQRWIPAKGEVLAERLAWLEKVG